MTIFINIIATLTAIVCLWGIILSIKLENWVAGFFITSTCLWALLAVMAVN